MVFIGHLDQLLNRALLLLFGQHVHCVTRALAHALALLRNGHWLDTRRLTGQRRLDTGLFGRSVADLFDLKQLEDLAESVQASVDDALQLVSQLNSPAVVSETGPQVVVELVERGGQADHFRRPVVVQVRGQEVRLLFEFDHHRRLSGQFNARFVFLLDH